jgi:hypothetical protein
MADPDDTREFTEAEKRAYNPQPCPDCGQRALVYPFVKVTSFGDQGNRYLRGIPKCSNRACPSRTTT